eukprot:1141726-Pelagomonas_calceolata.AAC.1
MVKRASDRVEAVRTKHTVSLTRAPIQRYSPLSIAISHPGKNELLQGISGEQGSNLECCKQVVRVDKASLIIRGV